MCGDVGRGTAGRFVSQKRRSSPTYAGIAPPTSAKPPDATACSKADASRSGYRASASARSRSASGAKTRSGSTAESAASSRIRPTDPMLAARSASAANVVP